MVVAAAAGSTAVVVVDSTAVVVVVDSTAVVVATAVADTGNSSGVDRKQTGCRAHPCSRFFISR
jgi:hypothetical protein